MKTFFHHAYHSGYLSYSRVFTVPKSFVSALLISIFFLAYIITDYWNIPGSSHAKLLIRDGTLCLGIIWGIAAGNSIKFEYRRTYLFSFCLLFLLILILNSHTLTSVIPWMGDEDHHIRMVLDLLGKVNYLSLFLILAAWSLVLYLSWRTPRWAVFTGILLLLTLLSSYPGTSLFGSLRYPFVNYWPYAFLINLLIPVVEHPYHEFLYRIIPFLSVIALTFIFQKTLSQKKRFTRLIWGVAVALIPTVYYYSSIFYLEMPIILLMTIVCLRIEKLLAEDFFHLKQDIGWYALVLVGFLKETTLPFLICFLIFRTVSIMKKRYPQLRRKPKSQVVASFEQRKVNLKWMVEEFAVYFILLMPILYYLIFRTPFVHRSYQFTISNLFDPVIYPVIFRALFDQFGAWILLFFVGCILLIKKIHFTGFYFYLCLLFGYILFFALDQKNLIGYSRFFLFLLPPLLAASRVIARHLLTNAKRINYAVLAILISTSLILSPIQKDGTKLPYWENYQAEHYYPVDDAILWMKEKGTSKSVLFSGLGYIYFVEFYFNKYDWHPYQSELVIADVQKTDQINLEIALSKAEKAGFKNVLHFIQGREIPRVPNNFPFHQVEVFENLSNRIILFSKNE